ncbi:hypothetical protein DUNSADRAFT_8508 [Dunaliella salina]|uniref:Uncharacterized protein n=1 Tax=Dunaliella salina TaxID=3046 RepID=A0ABQ7FST2_DUNSA|nr:hypothetical protein DUNSADRAFT_8508 [Dunaliella salina]|eukprot:KAF5825571.1 hypothetical protein DUNSADRAFT_8508 [Dunaliella salina]
MPEAGRAGKGLIVYVPVGSRVFPSRDSWPWMMEALCVKSSVDAPGGRLLVRVRVWQPATQGIAQVEVLTRIVEQGYRGSRAILLSSYKHEVIAGNTCILISSLILIGVADQSLVEDVLELGGFGVDGGDGGPQEVEAMFTASARMVNADGTVSMSGSVPGVGQVTIPDVLPVLLLMLPHAGQGVVERLQSPAGRMPAVFMTPGVTLKMTVQGGTIQGINVL